MLILPLRLKTYQYKLFENDPVRSEVIDSMSRLLNRFAYGYASINAILQLGLAALNIPTNVAIMFMLVIGWLPVTIQFIFNQVSVRNIVLSSKKNTLFYLCSWPL